MRAKFREWYNNAYAKVLQELQNHEEHRERFQSAYSRLEIEALKNYDKPNTLSAKAKLNVRLKAFYTKKKFSFAFNLPEKEVPIVWWPTQNKHSVLHLPVYQFLKDRGIPTAFVVDDSNFKKNLADEIDKVNHIRVKETTKFSVNLGIMAFTKKVMAACKKVSDFQMPNHSVRYADIVYHSLAYVYFYDTNKTIYKEAVKKLNPKLVVVGYELSIHSRTAALLSQKDGIETAAIQVGRMHYPALPHTLVDYYYVYGTKCVEYLKKSGVQGVKAFPAGSDKMETLGTEDIPREIEATLKDIRENYKQMVLVAFTGPGIAMSKQGHKANVAALHEMASKNPDVFYLCKLNTKDDVGFYSEASKLGNVTVVHADHPLIVHDIIHWTKKCDYLITAISTSGMQAMQLDKPVITMDVLGELEGNYLIMEDAFLYADSMERLLQFSDQLKEDDFYAGMVKESHEFSNQYFQKRDISSAEYIGKHMMSLLN